MATEKGLFQDEDRFSPAHQEMAAWFAQNAHTFVRRFLCDMPKELTTSLEVPVRSANGFLYGFADVVIDYETDQGAERSILIELKSRFRDFGRVLRQLNTYRAYLPNVTSVCFIHDDEWWDGRNACLDPKAEEWDWVKLERYGQVHGFFGSQGIYVVEYAKLREGFFGHYEVPSGRREAVLSHAYKHSDFPGWAIFFDVVLPDRREKVQCVSGFPDPPPDSFWQILKAAGRLASGSERSASLDGQLQVPCTIDVSHVPDGEGYLYELVEAMHSRDLSVTFKFDEPAGIRRLRGSQSAESGQPA